MYTFSILTDALRQLRKTRNCLKNVVSEQVSLFFFYLSFIEIKMSCAYPLNQLV